VILFAILNAFQLDFGIAGRPVTSVGGEFLIHSSVHRESTSGDGKATMKKRLLLVLLPLALCLHATPEGWCQWPKHGSRGHDALVTKVELNVFRRRVYKRPGIEFYVGYHGSGVIQVAVFPPESDGHVIDRLIGWANSQIRTVRSCRLIAGHGD